MAGVFYKGKKRKIEEENRTFQDDWEHDFFFVRGKKEGSAMCLLCREVIMGNKRYNLHRHYTTVHANFESKYPSKSKIRKEKLLSLKKSVSLEQKTLFNAVTKNELTTKASYLVTEILAKKMKPFTDAEIVKDCIVAVCNTLFSNLPNSKQIMSEVTKLQLSDSTCVRRCEDMSSNIFLHVMDDLQKCICFSLALDSSTDITSTSQLISFVRYILPDGEVKENFLTLIPMTGRTRGIDYLESVLKFFNNHKIDINKLFSVCSDGCPSMVGAHSGLISLLKKHLKNENLLSFHCIIHQESLSVKFGKELNNVMNKVVTIVNYIRSHELNHRMFQEFLKELISQYGDVLYHTEVRWLSKGRVLERFFQLRHEITLFLSEKKEFPETYDFKWWLHVAILTDVTSIINETMTKLQGDYNKIVTKMMSIVFSLDEKLSMYSEEVSKEDLSSFPSVETLLKENPDEQKDLECLKAVLRDLKTEMAVRFQDFRKYKDSFRLIENPWSITAANVAELAIFGFQSKLLKEELIDMQQDTELKTLFEQKAKEKEHYKFWTIIEENQFPNLEKCSKLILCIFASTYICESTFSKLKFIKNKNRSRLTSENLQHLLRIAVSTEPADIDNVLEACERFRPSTSKT